MAYGYVIAQVSVTDPDTYPDYIAQVSPLVGKYGGEYMGPRPAAQRPWKALPPANAPSSSGSRAMTARWSGTTPTNTPKSRRSGCRPLPAS